MDGDRGRLRLVIGSDVIELDVSRYTKPVVGAGMFPTVDEVQAELDAFAERDSGSRLSPIGNSPAGEPLRVLSVGRGEIPVLALAGGHPEPVGHHTAFALARAVRDTPALADRITLSLVACWDADAARLNRWYRGALTIDRYYREFYRPPAGWQPCATFPIPGRFEDPRPETAAVMRLSDEIRPLAVPVWHNGDFGGAWSVVNQRPPTGLAADLRAAAAVAGLPVQAHDSDVIGWESDGEGVFIEPRADGSATSMSGSLGRSTRGATIGHYLPDALVISPEVGLFKVRDIPKPACGYLEGMRRIGTELRNSASLLGDYLTEIEEAKPRPTVFQPAVLERIASAEQVGAWLDRPQGRPGAAQYMTGIQALHKIRLRAAGMLLRVLEVERATRNTHPNIRAMSSRVEQRFCDWRDECERALRPRPWPRERCIQVQLHAALLTAAHAASRVQEPGD